MDIAGSLNRQGYCLVENFFDTKEYIQPILDEFDEILQESILRQSSEKDDPSSIAGDRFEDKLLHLYRQGPFSFIQYFTPSLPLNNVTDETPFYFGNALYNLATAPELLDVLETILGPEIAINPILHVRIKMPDSIVKKDEKSGLISRTLWHQDLGVALPDADDTEMITVWIPLNGAEYERGCLQVIPQSHESGLVDHCHLPDGEVEIPAHLRPGEPIALPMAEGDILLLTKLTMHDSRENTTDRLRISLDLRYQPAGAGCGRPEWPTFLVRSRAKPGYIDTAESIRDKISTTRRWMAITNANLARRWGEKRSVCA